jgi:4-hydroxy-3-polyprenylbenzoate decarboxylase
MQRLTCLRQYIAALQALGEIQEVDVEVDWNLEMGAIIRRSYELRAPAPLFNRVKGIEPGFRVLGAPAGLSGHPGRPLTRIALSLGFPAHTGAAAMIEALAAAHARSAITPRLVADAPCKEHRLRGADVDLERLPAPLIHAGDGGRYLNTWGTIIVQTPDRRWTNWSITRIMVAGKNTMLGGVIPRQHLGMIYRQWQAIGRDMPFALAIGTEPVIPFVAGMPLDENVDEAGFIGGYLGEPVDVVAAETVELTVPATAEIVIEGTLAATETAWEGPMGEYSGYLAPKGGMPSPVFRVSAMTFRDRPILPVVAAGEPTEENHTCWGLTISAQILWELRQAGLPVTMCFCPFQSAAHWLAVTVHRTPGGSGGRAELVQELGRVLFRSRTGSYVPKVILLDDDVDPTNLDELVWAFATRHHPEHGQALFRDESVLPLVAFLTAEERRAARGTKVIYNCLSEDAVPPADAPRRSSFRFAWPPAIQERVVARWRQYGYGDPGTGK